MRITENDILASFIGLMSTCCLLGAFILFFTSAFLFGVCVLGAGLFFGVCGAEYARIHKPWKRS